MLTCRAVPLEKIPYVDSPEIRVSAHETTELPFRYVADAKGQPIMVDVGVDVFPEKSPVTDICIGYA